MLKFHTRSAKLITHFIVWIMRKLLFAVENSSMPTIPTTNSGSGASAEEAVPALSWPPETFEASGDEDSLMGLTNNG